MRETSLTVNRSDFLKEAYARETATRKTWTMVSAGLETLIKDRFTISSSACLQDCYLSPSIHSRDRSSLEMIKSVLSLNIMQKFTDVCEKSAQETARDMDLKRTRIQEAKKAYLTTKVFKAPFLHILWLSI